MTTLAIEQQAQRQWRLLPKWQHLKWFDRLIDNEFLPRRQQQEKQSSKLGGIITHAAENVPYYRDLFQTHGIDPHHIQTTGDLKFLPVLTKERLQKNRARLAATALSPKHRPTHTTTTSGSTGTPVSVAHSNFSGRMFGILKQRELRWFRFAPGLLLAIIRSAEDLPPQNNGDQISEGMTVYRHGWPYVGQYFHTGQSVGFADTNAVDEQVKWLNKHQPAYLLTMAASLEHLALSYRTLSPPKSILGIQAISQQLTDIMRSQIKRVFGMAVQQNYGLNEIGLVATRCPEGGRYHVHTEHCHVEIVNEDNLPCQPGETGRLLVTGLSNLAMPLLRYDTGDLATAADDCCSCSRTLSSFTNIQGRYRRLASLPPGTWKQWEALQRILEKIPDTLEITIHQYQVHQFHDGHFELKLATPDTIPEHLINKIKKLWESADDRQAPYLKITKVDKIHRGNNRKFENFTSDFMPKPHEEETLNNSLCLR